MRVSVALVYPMTNILQLKQMNLSGRNNTRLMNKIREYEQELVRLRAALRKADMSVGQSSDRGDLFSGIRVS